MHLTEGTQIFFFSHTQNKRQGRPRDPVSLQKLQGLCLRQPRAPRDGSAPLKPSGELPPLPRPPSRSGSTSSQTSSLGDAASCSEILGRQRQSASRWLVSHSAGEALEAPLHIRSGVFSSPDSLQRPFLCRGEQPGKFSCSPKWWVSARPSGREGAWGCLLPLPRTLCLLPRTQVSEGRKAAGAACPQAGEDEDLHQQSQGPRARG